MRRVRVELYGSLALTGKGHGTDTAILLGLEGERPDRVDPDGIPDIVSRIRERQEVTLPGPHVVQWREADDLIFRRSERLPFHPNGMTFRALDADGATLDERTYFSVGGGFLVSEENPVASRRTRPRRIRSRSSLATTCFAWATTAGSAWLR